MIYQSVGIRARDFRIAPEDSTHVFLTNNSIQTFPIYPQTHYTPFTGYSMVDWEHDTISCCGLVRWGVDHDFISPGYVLYTPLASCTEYFTSITGDEIHKYFSIPRGRHARLLSDGNLAYNVRSGHPRCSLCVLTVSHTSWNQRHELPQGSILSTTV